MTMIKNVLYALGIIASSIITGCLFILAVQVLFSAF